METGKLCSGSCSARSSSSSSIAVPTGTRMDIRAPLTAVYIHAVPSLAPQLLPAAPQQPATVHLNMPPLYSKDALPYLTLHIAGGLPTQQQQVSNITSAAPLSRPKAAGKHVCPHCGRDCMKPSVLEKHLRCHTGERPYPCTTCGVSFKTQSNLYKHKRTQAHARLSSESSGHGSMSSFGSVGSQDSAYGSRDTCASSLSLDGSSEESGSLETDVTAAPPRSVEIAKVCSGKKAGRGEDGVGEENQVSTPAYSSEPKGTEGQKPPSTASRHLPLQRQEATLFSKQWESSVSKGKSQNHDSTDSGFSESSEQYPGASVVSPEHGKDPNESAGQSGQEPKDNVCARGQKTLEERISKLISENSVVVDDKQLENVRPRKTVLSKQGSIDLPMPYTYKDSFHFDMRLSKAPNVGLQKHRVPALYSSVPTQRSTSVEHTPLTRSSSLPFNVTLLQPERSSPTTSFQRDYARRGSSGQIHPASLAITSVDQQVPNHRLLVRQAAVDCNHATDFVHSSAEEEGCNSSPVCGGDGSDICEEPSNKKYRRKKAQKFAYNKWYMYGGGTFKKLYSPEKGCDNGAGKSVCNPEHSAAQGVPKEFSGGHKGQIAATGSAVTSTNSSGAVFHPAYLPPGLVPGVDIHQKAIQLHPSCTPLKAPLHRNLSMSTMQLPLVGSADVYNTQNVSRAETHQRLVTHTGNTLELRKAHIPSDRNKQRTNYKIACPEEMETGSYVLAQAAPCLITSVPQPDKNQKAIQQKENLFPQVIINAKGTSGSTPSESHTLSTAKTDFLPKYQLKLPNAAKKHANSSPHSLTQSTTTNKSGSPSAVTSTATEKDDSLIAEAPQVSSLTATALCHPETSWTKPNQTAAPTVSAVHRQFTTITTTTATMHNHPAKRCTTTQVSPSNPVTGSIPWQLPERVAPVLRSKPTAVTKEGNHSPPAAFTLPSQSHNPIVSDTCALPAPAQLTLERGKTVDQKAPVLLCNMPYDSAQPAAQNVFHVQTADLQICLQIISDEQLALMEPQIERWGSPADGSLAQRSNLEAMKPDHIQSTVQTSVSTEILSDGRGHENTRRLKGEHQREPIFSHNPESIKPPTHFESARQSVFIADRGPAASVTHACAYYGSSGVPSNLHSHYDMIQDTGRATGHVSLLRGTVSGRSQTAEEKRTFPLSNLTEVHMIPQRNVSQKAKACDAICAQNKLNLKTMTFVSPGTAGENEAGNALLQTGSQQKPLNHSAIGNMDTLTDKCEGSVCEHITLENGKTHSPVQETECGDALPESSASDERQATSPATLNSIDILGSALSNSSIQSFENRDRGHDSIGSLTHSAPSRDKTLCESQNKIYSAQSEKHQGQYTSVPYTVQAEKSLGICTENQSPVAGELAPVSHSKSRHLVWAWGQARSADGGSLAACPEQEELGTGQQDGVDWEPNQSPEARERCHRCESVEIREVAGQQGPGGSDSCTETNEVLRLWERSKCNSRSGTDMSNLKNTEDEEKIGKAASNENSRLSEPHHQHPSQEHSGMLERPQPQQQQPNTLNNSDPPDSRLLGPPPPQKKMKSVFFSQQSSETHNQQMETLCGTDSTPHTDNSCVLQMENENGPPQCQQPLQYGTISGTKYQKQTGISLEVHTLPERETCSAVHSGVLSSSCCESESSPYSHTAPSLSSEGTDSSFTHHSQAFNSVCTGDLRAEQINAPATNNGFPETTMHPLKFLTPVYPDAECVTEQDFGQRATQNHTIHHNDPAKYQLLFSAGPLPSYTLECPANGLRPVQNCQDYPDDTSSSDDEGKLIIEL